jgi:hypothetical protein
MSKGWSVTGAISVQSAAHTRIEKAIAEKSLWYVGKPGMCPLYSAASKREAEFMLSRNLARQGYIVYGDK